MSEKTTRQIEEMKKQTIGVEIEMNSISRSKVAKLASQFFGTGRYKNTADRNGYCTYSAWDEQGREWKFQKDVNIAGIDCEKCEMVTPILIWEVTPSDEKALDRYEGYPAFYYKKDIKLQYKEIRTGKRRTINAFAYIMHEERQIGVPSLFYLNTCLEGYDTFYFDKQILLNAYKNSMEMCENEK